MHQRSPCVFRPSLSPMEKWGHIWPRLGSSHLELGDSLFPLVNPEIILHALAICLHRCEWEPLYIQHIVSDALVGSDSGSPYTPADSSACNKVTEPWSAPSSYTGTATTQTARSPKATAICTISCLRFLPRKIPLTTTLGLGYTLYRRACLLRVRLAEADVACVDQVPSLVLHFVHCVLRVIPHLREQMTIRRSGRNEVAIIICNVRDQCCDNSCNDGRDCSIQLR